MISNKHPAGPPGGPSYGINISLVLSLDDFTQMLSIVTTNDDSILVMGDFNLDISSVINLAISEHYCVFLCALLPSPSLVTEQVVRKRYLTSELLKMS